MSVDILVDEPSLENPLEKTVVSNTPPEEETTTSALETILEGDEVPVKFQGKPVAEILNSYKNLESQHGRLNQELGQTRAQLAQSTTQSTPSQDAPPPVEIDTAKLLENPREAIEQVVNHATAKADSETATRMAQMQAELDESRFLNAHPNYQSQASTDQFRSYVQADPYRQQMAVAAAQGDWKQAHALMDSYTSSSDYADPAAVEAARAKTVADAKQQAKETSLETGANGEAAVSGKVYSKAAIMKMRLEDPDTYEDPATQAELLKAYAEGRVK